jgi:hypothetical protein
MASVIVSYVVISIDFNGILTVTYCFLVLAYFDVALTSIAKVS